MAAPWCVLGKWFLETLAASIGAQAQLQTTSLDSCLPPGQKSNIWTRARIPGRPGLIICPRHCRQSPLAYGAWGSPRVVGCHHPQETGIFTANPICLLPSSNVYMLTHGGTTVAMPNVEMIVSGIHHRHYRRGEFPCSRRRLTPTLMCQGWESLRKFAAKRKASWSIVARAARPHWKLLRLTSVTLVGHSCLSIC